MPTMIGKVSIAHWKWGNFGAESGLVLAFILAVALVGEVVQLKCSTDQNDTVISAKWSHNGMELTKQPKYPVPDLDKLSKTDDGGPLNDRTFINNKNELFIYGIVTGDQGDFVCDYTADTNEESQTSKIQLIVLPSKKKQ